MSDRQQRLSRQLRESLDHFEQRTRALMVEAANAGDELMVKICRHALDGSRKAKAEVMRVLEDAEAELAD